MNIQKKGEDACEMGGAHDWVTIAGPATATPSPSDAEWTTLECTRCHKTKWVRSKRQAS